MLPSHPKATNSVLPPGTIITSFLSEECTIKILWIPTEEPVLQMNQLSVFSCQFCWWKITASSHCDDAAHIQYTADIISFLIIHEQVYGGVASTDLFFFSSQKLEEFLFCMEDNHTEVSNANTVNMCLNLIRIVNMWGWHWADWDTEESIRWP